MKRTLSLALALVLLTPLAACAGGGDKQPDAPAATAGGSGRDPVVNGKKYFYKFS